MKKDGLMCPNARSETLKNHWSQSKKRISSAHVAVLHTDDNHRKLPYILKQLYPGEFDEDHTRDEARDGDI